MRKKLPSVVLMVATLLVLPRLAPSQTAQQSKTLIVSGQPGQVRILQVDGKSYVNIEHLAQITNGTLSFKGNQVTLTLPADATTPTTTTAQTIQTASPGFSKDFLKAGIELGSTIREWRAALTSAVQNGYPVTDDFVAAYRNQVTTNLRLASVTASTDSDRNAYQLLSNLCDNMQQLSKKILAARQDMNYMSADDLRNDPLNQQILSCAQSLAGMAASGQFQDDGSCH
jgi:hypothetical protein